MPARIWSVGGYSAVRRREARRIKVARPVPKIRTAPAARRPVVRFQDPRDVPCEVLEFRFSPDGRTEQLLARRLGTNRYLLDETPVTTLLAAFGDTIEAIARADGVRQFVRILTPSGLRTSRWRISPAALVSAEWWWMRRELRARGGHTEHVYGGYVTVHVPVDSAFDADEWMRWVLQRSEGQDDDANY